MATGGLFITLYDEETLRLYLDKGVYGQHMPAEPEEPGPHSNHYRTMADYACARDGNHVFFFRDREIYYGGQINGATNHAAFYLNGKRSPLGRAADAPLVWDESKRDRYTKVDDGLFYTPDDDPGEDGPSCQPFILQFNDENDLAGSYIESDQLYFQLGEYPYPLPSNSISNRAFSTLTPGETQILLDLLESEPEDKINPVSDISLSMTHDLIPYRPEHGITHPKDAHPESHLEAEITANPSLLPDMLQPGSDTAICRQVPISPFKPKNMDMADVCYFGADRIREGTKPNTVIELKNDRAGKGAAEQVVGYCAWLHKRLGATAKDIDIYVFAPSFTRTFDDYIPLDYTDRIQAVTFEGDFQETLGT